MTRSLTVESIQTREARDRHAEAERVYRDHVRFRVGCQPTRRRWCADGQLARAIRDQAAKQLEHERAEDRKPYTGQGALFDD